VHWVLVVHRRTICVPAQLAPSDVAHEVAAVHAIVIVPLLQLGTVPPSRGMVPQQTSEEEEQPVGEMHVPEPASEPDPEPDPDPDPELDPDPDPEPDAEPELDPDPDPPLDPDPDPPDPDPLDPDPLDPDPDPPDPASELFDDVGVELQAMKAMTGRGASTTSQRDRMSQLLTRPPVGRSRSRAGRRCLRASRASG
jgi:hypothetical protein